MLQYLGFNPESNSYHTIADKLKQFEHINELPIQLKRRRALYYDKANLVEAFQENDAVFDKSCIAEFNKQKLSRKRKHQETFDDEEERSSNKENIRPLEICNRTSRSAEPKNDLKTVFLRDLRSASKGKENC